MMQLIHYQQEAYSYAEYQDKVYPYLGLAEEVGELLQIMAKTKRGDDMLLRYGSEKAIKDVITKEAGDVLWMLSAILVEEGISLDTVARTNLTKLGGRKITGDIKGHNRSNETMHICSKCKGHFRVLKMLGYVEDVLGKSHEG